MKKIQLSALMLLLLIPCILFAAVKKEKPIFTKQIQAQYRCQLPILSVDEETGTTMWVWSAYPASSAMNDSVWNLLITRDRKGAIKMSGPKAVIAPGNEGVVAFNSSSKEFLVAWSGFKTLAGADFYNDLRSKRFSLKGKAVGGTISYYDAKVDNIAPFLIYNPDADQYLMLFWRNSWALSPGPAGSVACLLDGDGEKVSEDKKFLDVIIHDGYVWPTHVICGTYNRTSKRFFFILGQQQKVGNDWKDIFYLYTLDNKGNLIGKVNLSPTGVPRSIYSRYAEISEENRKDKGSHLISWSDGGTAKVVKINKFGGLAGSPLSYPSSLPFSRTAVAYSASHGEYRFVYESAKGLVLLTFDSKLKAVGKPTIVSPSKSSTRPKIRWNEAISAFLLTYIERTTTANDSLYVLAYAPRQAE